MCGRYTYLYTWKQLHRLMRLLEWPQEELFPRYNVAPTQRAPVVRLNARGERAGVMLDWGLVPSWAAHPGSEVRPFNARGESIFTKPTFRKAARERRCLVPVSGFYEWQAVAGERAKQPYWIGRGDREPFCFGGLWESWQDREASDSPALETFTIVTTTPNLFMSKLHDRMPVIVRPDDWSEWLDPRTSQANIERLIASYLGDDFVAYPVSKAVNAPARDDPGLMERVSPAIPPPGLFE